VVAHRTLALSISLLSALFSVFLITPEPFMPKPLSELRMSLTGRQGLIIDTSVEAFSNPDDPSQLALERYRDQFGRDDHFMVLVEGDVFSLPFLKRLKGLHERLEALNIEVESLGERKADRLRKRAPQGSEEPDASSSAQPDSSESSDESFGDSFGEEEGGDAWGDEAGSTVIEEVTSLINVRRTKGTKDGIKVGEWCDPMPTTDNIEAFKREALADKTLVGQVIGKNGTHTVLLLRAQFMSESDSFKVNEAIAEIAREFNAPEQGFKTSMAGLPEMNATLKTSLLSTMRLLLMLSVVLMLGVLVFQFRHILGVLPPMIVVGISALNTFALMSLTGMPVTMLSNILPAFIFCVGIGDSVHLLSVYRDHFKVHHDSPRAVVETIATTGTPVLFTSLTTIVGLLSFKFASIPAIQQMGVAGATGVAAACLHSLLFLPVLLSFNKRAYLGVEPLPLAPEGADETDETDETGVEIAQTEREMLEHEPDWIDRFINLCADARAGLNARLEPIEESVQERRRRLATLAVGAVITLVAIYGASMIKVWHNPLVWLPKSKPVKQVFDTMDREIGGTANVQILIEGRERGVKDVELLKGLEQLERHIKAYRHPTEGEIIGNVMSVNDIVKETRRALKGGNDADYKLPDNNTELAQLLFLFENTGPDQLRRLASNDLKRSQMTVRLKWLEATSYIELTDHISEGIERFIPDQASLEPTGSVYTLVSTVGRLLLDLVRSFGAALIVISLMMILMLRSVKLGLISMIPNLMPILWLMGMMGFVGIPIDMNNILIASIAIGLAVDDTIHLFHHFRVYYEHEGDPHRAISFALQHSGRAMLSTSVILSIGFFAYMASEMSNIQTFGMLIGLSAALAMLIDLIFAPAFVRTFYPRKLKSDSAH
jgi:predicted RND superfamily exporter protein